MDASTSVPCGPRRLRNGLEQAHARAQPHRPLRHRSLDRYAIHAPSVRQSASPSNCLPSRTVTGQFAASKSSSRLALTAIRRVFPSRTLGCRRRGRSRRRCRSGSRQASSSTGRQRHCQPAWRELCRVESTRRDLGNFAGDAEGVSAEMAASLKCQAIRSGTVERTENKGTRRPSRPPKRNQRMSSTRMPSRSADRASVRCQAGRAKQRA
jgi:hypothetical protein